MLERHIFTILIHVLMIVKMLCFFFNDLCVIFNLHSHRRIVWFAKQHRQEDTTFVGPISRPSMIPLYPLKLKIPSKRLSDFI